VIENNGGKVKDLYTDAITCTFEDNKLPFELSDGKNIDGYYWDDKRTRLKYKLEPVGKHVIYPKMEKLSELTNMNIKEKKLTLLKM
jgi:hypothetical protein